MRPTFLPIAIASGLLTACVVFVLLNRIVDEEPHRLRSIDGDGSAIQPSAPVTATIDGGSALVAAIAAATGPAAENNRGMFDAVQLAVDEINAADGIHGRRIELRRYDTCSTTLGARAAARQAVADGAVAVIGALRSSHCLAMARVLDEAGIAMISPQATHPDVTRVGPSIYRICYVDSFQGRLLADFAYDNLAARRAALVINSNRIYSIELARVFGERFRQHGGQVVAEQSYLDQSIEHEALVAAITKQEPDVLFIPSEVRDAGYILKQLRQSGVDAVALGSDAWGPNLVTYAGEAADGSYFTTYWHPRADDRRAQDLIACYEDRFGPLKNPGILLSYDAAYLLADAIERAGSWQPPAICQALRSTEIFDGTCGAFDGFDEFGDPRGRGAAVLQIIDGRVGFHQHIERLQEVP